VILSRSVSFLEVLDPVAGIILFIANREHADVPFVDVDENDVLFLGRHDLGYGLPEVL
jgi:hypothetical protein